MTTPPRSPRKKTMSEFNVVIIPQKVALADQSTEVMYCAVCLDHFLVGEGKTAQAAMEELQRVFISTVVANKRYNEKPFQGIKQAPASYQALRAKGEEASRLCMQDAVEGFSFTLKPVLVSAAA